ncbi:MAG: WecB/TagA/CpsF family glycosyltransferase [Pirellulaceae bacterium]|nr:WecB/TagA/CpsF family glycosyltransferase [Planctomycetales bacterium]
MNDTPQRDRRVHLFGVQIDALTMTQAVRQLQDWIFGSEVTCHYVVTPNVDHTVMLQERSDLRAAYADASLILADGAPVVLASRLLGKTLPERVTGSDLVPTLFAAATPERPITVFLLGAAEGVADRAKENIERRWPAVKVVGTFSPPLGFEKSDAANEDIIRRVAAAQPDCLVVGLGAPKQELWVHQHHRQLSAKIALCVGATIDFLAGEKPRAPVWMQKSGLEWVHRLASEPRRLFKRYARDAVVFPKIVYREWRNRTQNMSSLA